MNDEIVIREYKQGDPSLVSHLHMMLYQKQYGFKGIFEHYVMKSLAEFLKDPSDSQLWVAVKGNAVVGSIAIVKSDDNSAQLRWFAVDEAFQGHGLGTRLMDKALRFCEDCGYKSIQLWTIEMLDAARHLYKKYGFLPTETKENTEWSDNVLVEEKWVRNR